MFLNHSFRKNEFFLIQNLNNISPVRIQNIVFVTLSLSLSIFGMSADYVHSPLLVQYLSILYN